MGLALGVVAWLLRPVSLPAQQEAKPRFEEELEVTEVLLDVLVTDKQDRVILGLGKDDFEVREDGSAVEITSITFYSSRRLEGSLEALERRGISVEEVPEDRYFILFFHSQLRASAEAPGLLARQLEAGEECRRWVRSELLPRDHVAVAAFDSGLGVLHDFSRDPEALGEAVSRAVIGDDRAGAWPSRRPPPSEGPSLTRNLPVGDELRKQTTSLYDALQVLARAAGSVRGRKILLFFGRGIGEIRDFGIWRPDPRFYPPTVEALNDNNVAVYPLDVSGRGVTRHSLADSLEALAADTGGRYYRYFNTFGVPLRQIADLNSGYYLLSYLSRRNPNERGFQRVEVSTRNRELKVSARAGYLFGD